MKNCGVTIYNYEVESWERNSGTSPEIRCIFMSLLTRWNELELNEWVDFVGCGKKHMVISRGVFLRTPGFFRRESNRHHPAVNHNYTKYYETWWINAIFSFLSITDRRKVIVLKSERRDFDLREAPTHTYNICFVKKEVQREEICRCNSKKDGRKKYFWISKNRRKDYSKTRKTCKTDEENNCIRNRLKMNWELKKEMKPFF